MTPNDVISILSKDISKHERMREAIQGLIESNKELAGQVIDLKRERDESRRIAIDSVTIMYVRGFHSEHFETITKWPEWVNRDKQ